MTNQLRCDDHVTAAGSSWHSLAAQDTAGRAEAERRSQDVSKRADTSQTIVWRGGHATACAHAAVLVAILCSVCSYKKLAIDLKPGSQILCADGSIVMEVISTDPSGGTVRARCLNTAMLG